MMAVGPKMVSNKAMRMSAKSALACLILSACARTVAVQGKPDFSGRWALESRVPAGVDVPRTLTVRQSIARTNIYGKPMTPGFNAITIEREFATLRRTGTYDIGVSGGFVAGVPGRHNDDPTDTPHGSHSVQWIGRQLLFTNSSYSGKTKASGPYTEHSELWTLERRDRLVIRISDESSDQPHTIVTLTYRKR